MRALRGLVPWLLCGALAACGSNPPSPPTAGPTATTIAGPTATTTGPTTAAPTATRGADKPGAPITLSLVARPLAGTATVDRYELVLTATPGRDLERLELAIDGQPSQVTAATAGAVGLAHATVELAHGTGRDVIATAVVIVNGKRMGAATQVHIGAAAADAPAGTLIYLPDGTAVQEVRP